MYANSDLPERYRLVEREDGTNWQLGTSAVYKGTDTRSDRPIAVRFFEATAGDSTVLDALKQRARILTVLRLPHLAALYEFGEREGVSFYLSEFVAGESLHDRIRRCGTLTEAQLLPLARQAAETLAATHDNCGLAHGELGPTKFLLVEGADGTLALRLVDFGLSRRAGGPAPARDLAEERADLYRLATTLWYALTGTFPYGNDVAGASDAPPPVEKLKAAGASHPMQELIIWMLEGEPASSQPPTAQEILEAIDRYLVAHPVTVFDPAATVMTQRPARLPEGMPRAPAVAAASTILPSITPAGRAIAAPVPAAAIISPASPAETTPPAPSLPQSAAGEETHVSPGPADLPASTEPPKAPEENVQFTAYRPKVIRPARWAQLLVFTHLEERPDWMKADERAPVEEVAAQARQFLGAQVENYRSGTDDSLAAIPRDGEITFVPEMDGMEFNPPRRSFFWKDGLSVHMETFEMRADPSLDKGTTRGRVTVYMGPLILAEIGLAIRIDSDAPVPAVTPDKDAVTGGTDKSEAQFFRRIFASYSHRDLAIVETVERHTRTLGDEYLRDWLHLRSGEIWSDRLLEMIKGADVFQLFWSSNAADSDFVRREWSYALSLGRNMFVRPTYWQDPMPPPPDGLHTLHFHRLAVDSGPVSLTHPGLIDAAAGEPAAKNPVSGEHAVENPHSGLPPVDGQPPVDKAREEIFQNRPGTMPPLPPAMPAIPTPEPAPVTAQANEPAIPVNENPDRDNVTASGGPPAMTPTQLPSMPPAQPPASSTSALAPTPPDPALPPAIPSAVPPLAASSDPQASARSPGSTTRSSLRRLPLPVAVPPALPVPPVPPVPPALPLEALPPIPAPVSAAPATPTALPAAGESPISASVQIAPLPRSEVSSFAPGVSRGKLLGVGAAVLCTVAAVVCASIFLLPGFLSSRIKSSLATNSTTSRPPAAAPPSQALPTATASPAPSREVAANSPGPKPGLSVGAEPPARPVIGGLAPGGTPPLPASPGRSMAPGSSPSGAPSSPKGKPGDSPAIKLPPPSGSQDLMGGGVGTVDRGRTIAWPSPSPGGSPAAVPSPGTVIPPRELAFLQPAFPVRLQRLKSFHPSAPSLLDHEENFRMRKAIALSRTSSKPSPAQVDQIVESLRSGALPDPAHPPLILVLAYADEWQNSQSLPVSQQCADSVTDALKQKGVKGTFYSYGMGSGVNIPDAELSVANEHRFVEIWSIATP